MMYILQVPENEDVTTFGKEEQAAIASVNGQFPESIMLGTQAVGGYQIVLAYASTDKATLESMISSFALDWIVLACEDEPVNQPALLPYFVDVITYDEDGAAIGSEQVTDLTDKLQVFSGRNWTF